MADGGTTGEVITVVPEVISAGGGRDLLNEGSGKAPEITVVQSPNKSKHDIQSNLLVISTAQLAGKDPHTILEAVADGSKKNNAKDKNPSTDAGEQQELMDTFTTRLKDMFDSGLNMDNVLNFAIDLNNSSLSDDQVKYIKYGFMDRLQRMDQEKNNQNTSSSGEQSDVSVNTPDTPALPGDATPQLNAGEKPPLPFDEIVQEVVDKITQKTGQQAEEVKEKVQKAVDEMQEAQKKMSRQNFIFLILMLAGATDMLIKQVQPPGQSQH